MLSIHDLMRRGVRPTTAGGDRWGPGPKFQHRTGNGQRPVHAVKGGGTAPHPPGVQNLPYYFQLDGRGTAPHLGAQHLPYYHQQREPTAAERLQQAYDSANEANESRYREGLGIYDQMFSMAGNLGDSEREMIRRNTADAKSGDIQNLMSSGMAGTTVRPQLDRARDLDAALMSNDLNDRLLRTQLGVLGDRAGFIERRSDVGPDPAMIAELERQAAARPGGGSGGRSGGAGRKWSVTTHQGGRQVFGNGAVNISGTGWRGPLRISSSRGGRRYGIRVRDGSGGAGGGSRPSIASQLEEMYGSGTRNPRRASPLPRLDFGGSTFA